MRTHILWGKRQVAALQKMVGEKVAISKIAAHLGKSEKSIRRKCERLGLSSSTTYQKSSPKSL